MGHRPQTTDHRPQRQSCGTEYRIGIHRGIMATLPYLTNRIPLSFLPLLRWATSHCCACRIRACLHKAAAAGLRAQIHLCSGVCPAISACRRRDHQRPVTWRRCPANHKRRPGPAADANGMWLAVLSLLNVEGLSAELGGVAVMEGRRKAKSRICIRILIFLSCIPDSKCQHSAASHFIRRYFVLVRCVAGCTCMSTACLAEAAP